MSEKRLIRGRRHPCPVCGRKPYVDWWGIFCSKSCEATWAIGVTEAGPGHYDEEAQEWRDLA